MSLRSTHSAVRSALILNDEFVFAHLIKFEKPKKSVSSISTVATDFAYVTDGPYPIEYEENIYIPNKVYEVGSVSETTMAKATNITLKLAASSLGTEILDNFSFVAISNSSATVTATKDLLLLGFREGDTVKVAGSGTNNGVTLIINSITNSNRTLNCTLISGTVSNEFAQPYSLGIENPELNSLLISKSDDSYASYIHRQVTINRVMIDPKTGATLGDPYVFFQGYINKGSLAEDVTRGTTVSWGLTSHWGDFIRVKGRMTSDRHHRALGVDNKPDLNTVHRQDYAEDYGFEHSERAVNITASYMTKEKRYKMKSRGGLAGVFGMKKTVEYDVDVVKDVDLRFNLSAKFLPVVYGVQKVDSFPVFADTLVDNPETDALENQTVFIAMAICEGEIGGIYDVHIDDASSVCVDGPDSVARSTSTDSNVFCAGRMDRGDVLGGAFYIESTQANVDPTSFKFTGDLSDPGEYNLNRDSTTSFETDPIQLADSTGFVLANGSSNGLRHQDMKRFRSPLNFTLTTHMGVPNQRVNYSLLNQAAFGNFKIQKDYFGGSPSYWQANHRLLDTAYAVGEFTLAEGESTVPKLTYVVKGKFVDCFNYDGSYNPKRDSGQTSGQQNFILGDSVTFHKLDGTQISAGTDNSLNSVKIIDKFDLRGDYATNAGALQWRFRWDKNPNLPSDIQEFYMRKVTDTTKKWYMIQGSQDFAAGGQLLGSIATADIMEPFRIYSFKRTGDAADNEGNSYMMGGGSRLGEQFSFWSSFSKQEIMLGHGSPVITLGDNTIDFIDNQTGCVIGGSQGDGAQKEDVYPNMSYTNSIGDDFPIFSYTGPTGRGDQVAGNLLLPDMSVEAAPDRGDGTPLIRFQSSHRVRRVFSDKQGFNPDGLYRTSSTYNAWRYTEDFNGGQIQQGTPMRLGIVGAITDAIKITLEPGVTIEKGQTIEATFSNGVSELNEVLTASSGFIRFVRPFKHLPGPGTTFLSQKESYTGDTRVTTNPALQLLDYLTNNRYGKGLDIDKDIDVDSFLKAARVCDTRSDVTTLVPPNSFSTSDIGSVYKVGNNNSLTGRLIFEGTIKSIENKTALGGSQSAQQVTFTSCIGKLGRKWTDWRDYTVSDYVYIGNTVYQATSNGKIEASAINNSLCAYTGAITLSRVSGADTTASSVNIIVNNGRGEWAAAETGNPLVRQFYSEQDGFTKSGYSLYDSDVVKFWKFAGWDQSEQRCVTRHQTNIVVSTDKPLFNNVNEMLSNFNGILRFVNGKYTLAIESKAPTELEGIEIDGTVHYPAKFNKEDIIGKLKIDDKQQKDTFNSISTNIIDPQNKFGGRDVTFFNSDFLKQDRGISKSGNLSQPGITNYFNARINAEKFLNASRAGLIIKFRTFPRANLLLAGEFIKLTHKEFGFSEKLFRISNLMLNSDGLVDITAIEYTESSYILSGVDKGIDIFEGTAVSGQILRKPLSMSSIVVSQSTVQSVLVSWTNNRHYSPDTHAIQVLRNSSNDRNSASVIAVVRGTEYQDVFDNTSSSIQNYYWLQYKVFRKNPQSDEAFVLRGDIVGDIAISASSGFLGVSLPLNAANVKYADGNTIEILEPAEPSSDSTSNALNNNIGSTQSATLEVTSSNGGMIFNAGGAIRSSGKASASSSIAGFFLGYDTNKYTFGVGDDLNNIEWNGTNLSVTGKVTAASGAIGGWKITGSSLYAGDLTDSDAANFIPSGYINTLSATQGAILLHNQGSLHSKDFFINSDGSASFKGDISGATGTFSGGVGEQTITGTEIQDGSIGANELAPEAISGFNISPEGTIAVFSRDSVSGSIIESSYAALDGADEEFRIYAGSTAAGTAPFRVSKTGQVVADNLQLFDNDNNLFFDSASGGFSDSALTQIAQSLTARVDSFSELFTGELNTSTASTFEKITLTQSTPTTLSSTVRIPARMAKTANAEYYGNRSNPYNITVDCSGLTSDCSLNLASILKPGGVNSATSIKLGELIRVNLLNTVPGMTLKSVVGAKNALTGSDFATTTSISAPATGTYFLLELDNTSETLSFTVSSLNTSNITMNAGSNTAAKPDTEATALAAIPSSVEFGLSQRTDGDDQSTSSVVLASAVFSKTTGSSPAYNQYRVKTVSKDIIDVDTIHSTVSVVSGGCIDGQGFISRSTVQVARTAGDYFFYSNLSVTGGETAKRPTKRLFNVSVGSNDKGFIIQGTGTATQSDQSEAFSGLVLSGNMSVPDNFTIDPGSVSNDVIIAGNLVVQGSTTTTSSNTLEIGSGTILLSANAATLAAVHNAGLEVDRSAISAGGSNPTFVWDQTTYSSWKASHSLTAPQFRTTTDGTSEAPGYIFGSRTENTGIYASDASQDGLPTDQINISTEDKNSSPKVSFFNYTGITSHNNVYTHEIGEFRNETGIWKATTGSDNGNFQFIHNSPTNIDPILHLDACAQVAAINSDQTKGSGLYIKTRGMSDSLFNANPNTFEYIRDSLLVLDGGSTSIMTLLHGDGVGQDGVINFGGDSTPVQIRGNGAGAPYFSFRTVARNTYQDLDRLQLRSGHDSNIMTIDYKEEVPGGSAAAEKDGKVSVNNGAALTLFNNATLTDHNYHGDRPANLVFGNWIFNEEGSVLIKKTRGVIGSGTAYANAGGFAYGFIDFSTPKWKSDYTTVDNGADEKLLYMSHKGSGENWWNFGSEHASGTGYTPGMYIQQDSDAVSRLVVHTNSNSVTRYSALVLSQGQYDDRTTNAFTRLMLRRDGDRQGTLGINLTSGAGHTGIHDSVGTRAMTFYGDGSIDNIKVGIGRKFNDVQPKSLLQLAETGFDVVETLVTTTSGSSMVCASWGVTDFRSAKALITMQEPQTGKYLMTELSILFTGSNPTASDAHITEYGTVVIGGDRDCFFDISVASGMISIVSTNPNYVYPGNISSPGKRYITTTLIMHQALNAV